MQLILVHIFHSYLLFFSTWDDVSYELHFLSPQEVQLMTVLNELVHIL